MCKISIGYLQLIHQFNCFIQCKMREMFLMSQGIYYDPFTAFYFFFFRFINPVGIGYIGEVAKPIPKNGACVNARLKWA